MGMDDGLSDLSDLSDLSSELESDLLGDLSTLKKYAKKISPASMSGAARAGYLLFDHTPAGELCSQQCQELSTGT